LPNIRIRAPCNDTCGECTIIRNAFRYCERRQQTSENSDDSDYDKLEDEHGNDNERHTELKEGEDEVRNLAKYLLTSDVIRQEAVIEAAGFHVTQSRAMRGMVQYRTQEAIESLIALKRHDTRDRVLVFDYAQNVNYPHYGGEQPGEIYYLSALTSIPFSISVQMSGCIFHGSISFLNIDHESSRAIVVSSDPQVRTWFQSSSSV
jgi:hypothetical protein